MEWLKRLRGLKSAPVHAEGVSAFSIEQSLRLSALQAALGQPWSLLSAENVAQDAAIYERYLLRGELPTDETKRGDSNE